jgi:chemotaxis protein methyltransferase CheR
MIDEVTTNKTDFFREPAHFNYLTSRVLPTILRSDRFTVSNKLTIWSAGCSQRRRTLHHRDGGAGLRG